MAITITKTAKASFSVMGALLVINYFFQILATPGHIWVAYFLSDASYKLDSLDKEWSAVASSSMQSLVHLQKIINLHRLSPDEFIPVAIFSSIDAQGIIRYYGRDNLMIEKNSFVVIGPEGILGRADYKNEDFFKLSPITQNEIRTPAMLAPQGGILLLVGTGDRLAGFDKLKQVKPGALLITLGSDIHYPPYYPIARIEEVNIKEDGYAFIAKPLQDFHHINYGLLYRSKQLPAVTTKMPLL